MRPKVISRLAWALWALALVATVGALALVVLNRTVNDSGIVGSYVAIAVISMSLATSGVLIVSNIQGNAIGWILMTMGIGLALGGLSEQYVLHGLVAAPGSLPAVAFMGWLSAWTYQLVVVPAPIVFLLFPTGRPASRRWAWVLWTSVSVAVIAVLFTILYPGHEDGITNSLKGHGLHLINPTGILPANGWDLQVLGTAGILGVAAGILSIISVVLRYRRADGEQREQIKWLAFVGIGTVVLFVLMITSPLYAQDTPVQTLEWILTFGFALLGIPTAIAIAILKYRLYDIDLVINKTVVYAGLAAFITAVYVAIVVGVGALIGAGTSKPNLALSILATAVVAVAFQPVRSRMQRFANRFVYGQRATPYEVLSQFSARMAQSFGAEEVLPRMARILAEGTGARTAVVWLNVAGRLTPEAAWPLDDLPTESFAFTGEELPAIEATLALPVRHRGELLGALSMTKAPGDRLTPAEEHLATDLASGAGLVLRNVRLTEEIRHRMDEIRDSRTRIVAASDAERRRLERNIHDGAQQQLVALAVKVRLARSLADRDPEKAGELLGQTEREVSQALEDLRDLARGIYPPLLADRGLVAALEGQARRAPLPVEISAQGVARYPQDQEAAVYFCVLEALQNVSKYAGATRAAVRLSQTDHTLAFEVEDDGVGFDPAARGYGTGMQGMADRLSALGGELRVRSAPGGGTTVTGHVPVPAPELVG